MRAKRSNLAEGGRNTSNAAFGYDRLVRFGALKRHWERLGRQDPYGAVLTRGVWDVERFFRSGVDEITAVLRHAARLGLTVSRRRALDFGCGVGRVSQALAAHFDRVVGVDVASSMIAQARQINRVPERCSFELNRAIHLRRFDTGSFDLVYSRMVLQHMPPPLVRGYLPELVRVVAPGGALVFQLPGRIGIDSREVFLSAPVEGSALKRALPRPLVRAWRALKYQRIVSRHKEMAMYGMDRDAVVALIQSTGARILDIHDDYAHGTEAPGFEYCVTK